MTKVTAKRGDEEAAGPGELKRLHVGEAAQGSRMCSSRSLSGFAVFSRRRIPCHFLFSRDKKTEQLNKKEKDVKPDAHPKSRSTALWNPNDSNYSFPAVSQVGKGVFLSFFFFLPFFFSPRLSSLMERSSTYHTIPHYSV